MKPPPATSARAMPSTIISLGASTWAISRGLRPIFLARSKASGKAMSPSSSFGVVWTRISPRVTPKASATVSRMRATRSD